MVPNEKVIVVCDDAHDILSCVCVMLQQEGYTVLTAGGHKELMGVLGIVRPDLLVLDIQLPEKDGYMIAEGLQAKQYNVPILFMTAFPYPPDKPVLPFAAAVDYMAKPFTPDEFLQRVRKILEETSHPIHV